MQQKFLGLAGGLTLAIKAPANVLALLNEGLPLQQSFTGLNVVIELVWNKEVYTLAKDLYWKKLYSKDDVVWNSDSENWMFMGFGFGFFLEKSFSKYYFYIEESRLEDVLTFNYPLLNFIIYLNNQSNYSPIHAAAIGLEKQYVLLPGKQNTGKSTTTAAWALSGGNVISDDMCFVNAEKPLEVYGTYPSVRLRAESLSLFAENFPPLPLKQKGNSKHFLNLLQLNSDVFKMQGQVKAIFCLHKSNGYCSISEGSLKDAYHSLASSMAFTVNNKADAPKTVLVVKKIVHALPVFDIGLGPNLNDNVRFLKEQILLL